MFKMPVFYRRDNRAAWQRPSPPALPVGKGRFRGRYFFASA